MTEVIVGALVMVVGIVVLAIQYKEQVAKDRARRGE